MLRISFLMDFSEPMAFLTLFVEGDSPRHRVRRLPYTMDCSLLGGEFLTLFTRAFRPERQGKKFP